MKTNFMKVIAFTVVLLSIHHVANAQSFGSNFCGTPDNQAYSPSSPINQCFTVDIIQDNCTTIWLRINIHFFLDNNCQGNIHPLNEGNYSIEDAYEVAEQIIDDANNQLENNKKQWNQEPLWNIFEEKPAQCVPFRYALSGVFVHCDEIAMNTPGWDLIYFKNNFGVSG